MSHICTEGVSDVRDREKALELIKNLYFYSDYNLILFQDQFMAYMMDQAIKMEYKVLIDNKPKFVMVHSSSGFKHSLKGRTTMAINKMIYLGII